MKTAGIFDQLSPNTDGQIFISAAGQAASAGVSNSSIGLTGLSGMLIPASTANAQIFCQFESLLLRTGMYAPSGLQNLSSQAFGTANGPGPSTVVGTSSPDGFGQNSVKPPVLKVNLPALVGSVAGPTKKGIQINWIDFIYQTLGGALTSLTGGLTAFNPAAVGNDVAVTPSILINSTAMDTTVNSANTKVHRVRLTATNPAMLVTDATILSATLQATTPAGVTLGFAGVILGVNYNFN